LGPRRRGIHELGGQPVQQLGMRRRRALESEVVGRADESAAEVVLPDSIHHYARRQRILGACDPVGERQPPTAALGIRWHLGKDRLGRPQNGGESGLDFLSTYRGITAHQNERVSWPSTHFLDAKGLLRSTRRRSLQAEVLAGQLSVLVKLVQTEESRHSLPK